MKKCETIAKNNDLVDCIVSHINENGPYYLTRRDNSIDICPINASIRLCYITCYNRFLHIIDTIGAYGYSDSIDYNDPNMFQNIDEHINISFQKYVKCIKQ